MTIKTALLKSFLLMTSNTSGSEQPRVTIVVLNWNNYEDTAACLESLSDIKYSNYRVVIVDNGSTDGSGEELQDEFGECEFIFNDENLGFAAGVNVGINYALDAGTDYILLLNNDIIVEPDFLHPLVDAATRDNVAATSGIIKYMHNDEIWFAGGEVNRYLSRASHWQSPKDMSPYESEFITGALMLIDSEFIKEINGMDEMFFFGHEDLDFSVEARQQGKKLVIVPEVIVHHDVSSTAGSSSPFSYYHSTRNRLKFARYRLSAIETILFLLIFLSTRVIRVCQWTIVGDQAIERAIAICRGIIDEIYGREFRKPEDF